MTNTIDRITINYFRLGLRQWTTLFLIPVTMLFMVACNTSRIVSDIETGMTILDDATTIAGSLGVIPAPVAAAITAGETCFQSGVIPALQNGGTLGADLKVGLNACFAAAKPLIPPGTDTELANKVDAAATDIASILSGLGITIPAATTPSMSARAVVMPSAVTVPKLTSADKAKLAKLAAHKFTPLPTGH